MRMESRMAAARRKKRPSSTKKAARPTKARKLAAPTKPAKRARNLSLAPEVIAHGEAYSRRHGTNLSTLVGDFLRALPLDGSERPLSPAVRRLYGAAAGGKTSAEDFAEHLHRKYTAR